MLFKPDLYQIFLKETEAESIRQKERPEEKISEDTIRHLPEPVKKYFRYCGFIGKDIPQNAAIVYDEFYLKMAPDKGWTKIEAHQLNFVSEPSRFVYMKSKVLGIIPFEGRDKFQDGKGNMTIRLLKGIPVAEASGTEMDASALVTVLAEALLVPGYALSKFISWSTVTQNCTKATLRYRNLEVSGLFYFNDEGEFIKFETYDRYFADKKTYTNAKWTVTAGNYKEKSGIKFPQELKARWNFPEGDFEYFKGKIQQIRFNV